MRPVPFLVLLPAACGGDPPAPGPPASRPPDDLRAVGYAGWDEGADETLAGVVRHDERRAWPGVNLYADDGSGCLALDMRGAVVHRWTVPGHDQVEVFALLDGGRIVAVSVDQGVTLLERDSTPVWQRDLAAHHDVAVLPDGGFVLPVHAERVHAGRRVRFDQLVWLDAQGAETERWDTWEHRAELADAAVPHALDAPAEEAGETVYDYFHLNSVSVLPDGPLARADDRFRAGNLLLCLRNTSTLVVLDGRDREVLWRWGAGVLDWPHTPSVTPEGRILVFDNGRHRGWSRVIEVDPATGEVAWSHEGNPREAFFSEVRGACQRLPNGNTLITESERGRVFEVTRGGDVVWELFHPEVRDGARKRIYRMWRVPAARLGL